MECKSIHCFVHGELDLLLFYVKITALKDASEHVGGNATFKYKVPHEGAAVEWMHNGKRIYPEKNPEKYQVISDGLNKTLVIKNLKEEEQGTLGVKVADKMCTAKLQVQGVFTTTNYHSDWKKSYLWCA